MINDVRIRAQEMKAKNKNYILYQVIRTRIKKLTYVENHGGQSRISWLYVSAVAGVLFRLRRRSWVMTGVGSLWTGAHS